MGAIIAISLIMRKELLNEFSVILHNNKEKHADKR